MAQHTAATLPPARGKGLFALRLMGVSAFLCLILCIMGGPALAKKSEASQLGGRGQDSSAVLRQSKDPVAQKLLTWLYASDASRPAEPRDLMRFVRENKDWPRLHAIRRKIEVGMADSRLSPQDISAWFADYPPLSYYGIGAYLDALLDLKKESAARAALAAYWPQAELSKNQVAALAARYKKLFAKDAMATRLDKLIWQERFSEADTMLAFVAPNVRALGYARLALARQAPDANSALAKVSPDLRNTEGLMFERMRYRRRKDSGDSALEILAAYTGKQKNPDAWWSEIHIMARRALERGDYRGAHRIARRHQLQEGANFASAHWLLGWLSLRHLNDPVNGYRHFDTMYRHVGSAVSRARAAYWAAQAAEKLNEAPTAAQWHGIAAFYPSTFYGQLSYIALHGKPEVAAFTSQKIPQAAVQAFHKRPLVRAVELLHKAKLTQATDPFFAKLLALASSKDDFRLIARLADKIGRRYYAVEANKQMQQTVGGFALEEGYPLLSKPLPKRPDAALIHAIVHRESMFDSKAQSHAGARGLMQLMPATAKELAKKTKQAYKQDKLTSDPRYNVSLGSAYLAELVDRYNGHYPMAVAAYNAGPSRINRWIDMFGDPRRGDIATIEWIEHIPIYETRTYVQRVMESYFLYRLKLGQTPKTVKDFSK